MAELEQIKALTPVQWAGFLLNHVVYIKPVIADGETAYAIHAADGRPLALIADHDVAYATASENGFEPMSVH